MNKIDHLLEVLLGQGIPVVRISGDSAENINVVYQDGITQDQLLLAQTLINSFDWSDQAHINWLLAKNRDERIADIDQFQNNLIRAIVMLTVDEINDLRTGVIADVSAVWDAPNLANGSGATSPAISAPGVAIGDEVVVLPPVNLQGLLMTGFVSSANNVQVRLHNATGGAINLASATWRVIVRRPVLMNPRTYAQAKAAILNKIMTGLAD